MKKIIIAFSCMLSTFLAQSQINMVRYNDDFSYLKNDTVHKKNLEKLKYISLSKVSNISFGGELREQYQYYCHPNFGDKPPGFTKNYTSQLLQRVMVHTNIEFGSKLRVFVQLGSTFRFFNPNPAIPEIDENKLSVHQGFVDYHFQKKWLVRLGRQEIAYASHRLLTFREGPNNRLAFDAAVIKYNSQKRKIDLFAMSPVISGKGILDDESLKDLIIGVYATGYIVPKKFLVDYYFLNLNTQRRKYNFVAGKENRQSYGVRIFSDNQKINYELEGTYQSGKFNQSKILAYGISADLNYKMIQKNNFIIGIGSNYMTGDKNKNDNQLNTYNLLFSKPQYGLTAPIGATNLVNINPYFKINPNKKSNIYVSSYFMWRQSTKDGSYSPTGVEVRPASTDLVISPEKSIGTLLAIESSYSLTRNLSFFVDGSYFFAGKYVRQSGTGKNITYLSFKGVYKF
ncbi:MAG: alginate export family protein [Ginsengibacter sp.]